MKIPVLIAALFLLFSAQVTGLREIKVGDKLPGKESLRIFDAKGNKLILYIKSQDIKSIAFFKRLTGTFKVKKKDVKLYIVDANPAPETDKRLSAIYAGLKVEKELVRDGERKIYGDLGIIVIPTLLFVTGDNTLHSIIAGNHPNLPLFFKSHFNALLDGKPPENVYEKEDRLLKEKKVLKMLNQGFFLLVNGNFDLAHGIYRKAAAAHPENQEARLGVGYSLIFMDKIEEALAYFTGLKEKDTDNRVLLGYYLCQSMKAPTEESLEKTAYLAQRETRFYFVAFQAGLVLDKAGKCEESKKVFRHSYKVLLRHQRRNK
ncbi:MAG: tetratricopeptide repeat protein [bacterium]|nr:tetratricopeptide repeat protein [bacterium]